MNTLDSIQYVELFHLIFLDLLGRKLDKRYYVLKGGCNLRFFLKSFRYSEDMDIDVQNIPKEKLEETVNSIITSVTFRQILKINSLTVDKWSAPKQTETTQRWKFTIMSEQGKTAIPTKIEFSRRGFKGGTLFEAVTPLVIQRYSLSPIMANHYDIQSAFGQKVEALATRKITQARDVFDLNLLLCSGANPIVEKSRLLEMLDQARANAMSVTFPAFKSQVLSYLAVDYRPQYDSESVWDDVVLRVVEALERSQTKNES
ncbi:MAG: nucleotidyl transferase AbiEii/AbiGii toxin family protein [Victivallales bacterium]|jgi:predicted nucleotidyltransferase component of viral defense system